MAALSLPWSPSKVVSWYCIGGGFGNVVDSLGGDGIVVGRTVGDSSTVIHFENIARTAFMAASWESQRLTGTSLIAAYKKGIACVIMSSRVTVG